MAGNMQQHMAPGGPFMAQQQNRMGMGSNPGVNPSLAAHIFQVIQQNATSIPPGWQAKVSMTERLQNVHQLTTSMHLANGGNTQQHQTEQILKHCLSFEQEVLIHAPEKAAYDQRIKARMEEFFAKRNGQAPRVQEALSLQQQAQARQQMMLNVQQNQNMLRAQMAAGRGMGPGQQSFQHLQNPMQLSQLQQQPPQMGLGLGNSMPPQMNHAPPGFPMPSGPQHPPHLMQLSEADRTRVQQDALAMFQNMTPDQRKAMQEQVISSMTPQAIQQMQATQKNPLMQLFVNKAQQNLMKLRQSQQQQQQQMQQMQQRQQQGMPTNFQGMPMQPGQQRAMNPNLVANMGQQSGPMPFGNSNMETILEGQKQGMMAERQGQVVVPANSGPGPNGASHAPAGNLHQQSMFSQGPGQPRQQMPPGYDIQIQRQLQLQQQQAHQKARQAAANLQGQPGGSGGPMPGSQAPAMNNLNAPGPPPGAMALAGPQGDAGNNGFAPGLDPRFFQQGQPNLPSGSQQDQMAQQVMARLPPEQRAQLMGLPRSELALKLKQLMQSGNNPNQMSMPNQQANGNLPPNAQAMLQAQHNRQRIQALHSNPRMREAMDSMDVPKGVFQALKGIPEGVTKWGQLKAWLPNAIGVSDETKAKLHTHQANQFSQRLNQNPSNPNPQQIGARPRPEDLARIPVTPHEIQQMRLTHAQSREAPEGQVRQYVQLMKWSMHYRQNANAGGRPQPGQGLPQTMAAPAAQTGVPPVAPQGLPQGQLNATGVSGPEPQSSARPIAQPNKSNRPQQQQQTKPVPQNPSPAVAVKNLKRPMEDDTDASSQPPASGPRPASQTGQPNLNPGSLSEAQMANMSPEQRQNLERKRQLYGQLARINAEEKQNFDPSIYPEVQVPENQQTGAKAHLLKIAGGFKSVSNPAIMRWFMTVRDEERLRNFFRSRWRVVSQFEDADQMQVLKDRTTVSGSDLVSFSHLLQGVINDLRRANDGQSGQALQQSNQAALRSGQAAPQPQPNEATSTKQAQVGAQAHNKLSQRPTSRGIAPPSAPISTQPPFQFGAASPDGKPLYAPNPPQLTQDGLQLPRKKMKTGMQTSSPAGGSQTASPQTKTVSPDLRKQEHKVAPPKPTFPCTAPDCEMGAPVFTSEALRKKHIDEFHTQPFQEPAQFLEQAIVDVFEFVNQNKADTAPLQINVVGEVAQHGKADGKTGGAASRGPDNNAPAVEAQQPATLEEFSMANGTIDPQSLFAPAFNFDPIAGGVISNTSLYRSTTPNEDTPESSKDSGTSEPNSDIPETGSLDIDIDLVPDLYFHDSFSLNSPGTYYQGDDEGYYAANMIEHIVSTKAYEIPQSIDMSLYSMDC